MTPRQRPPRPDDAAILRYVSGESPLAESEAIREWINTDADFAASVAELHAAWRSARPADVEWDKQGVWHQIATEMRTVRHSGPFGSVETGRRWMPYAIAAGLILLIGGGALEVQRGDRGTVAAPITYRDIVTARAQQAALDLPDGSRVTLAADSKLRIPSNYNDSTRVLHLVGRAYFEVKHDSTRPFLVRTATATTEDIGTAFVVTSYPEQHRTQVVVSDGAVALWAPTAEPQRTQSAQRSQRTTPERPLMLLTFGDVAVLDSNGTATLNRNVDVARYLSWTRGLLRFDGIRLRDAIPEMQRWYDVEIRLADAELGARRITAELKAEPASRAAERLGLVLGVHANRTGRTITLGLNGSQSERQR